MAEPGRVLFLKYDEMLAAPANHVKMPAEFIGALFTGDEESSGIVQEIVRLCSFENLKKLPVNLSGVTDPSGGGELAIDNSVYFRAVGDWKNYVTEEMAKEEVGPDS